MTDAALLALYDRIAERCREVGEQGKVPCAPGCDTCCQRLAQPPQLTPAEWEHLRGQLKLLSKPALQAIRSRVDDLRRAAGAIPTPAHFVCPLLDQEGHSCLLYLGRPAACRTYGYYVDEGKGLWCQRIVELQQDPKSDVVWGNQAGVDAELARISGPARGLHEWFESLG
jgi:Fe-S-cluster containining protein